MGRIADALEKPRGHSISAAYGLQGADAESADEFDALLDDVQSAGLSGVDRLNGASLIANVINARECRPDVELGSHSRRVKQQLRVLRGVAWSFFPILRTNGPRTGSCWNSGRTSDQECRKSDGDDESSVSCFGSRGCGSSPQSRMGMAFVGLPDPEGRHNMQLSPLEQSGLISFHRETPAYEEAKR